MSPPPATRSSRSGYSSPAVGGSPGTATTGGTAAAGLRNSNGRSRDRGRDKDKKNNAGSAAAASSSRGSSTERSRRFMESWIEPERVRMPSFQEDGLVRQGVLETMEPLGTRPKPAMIKKLTGMGREGSPTSSTRGGKSGGKKIVLKRKNGASVGSSSTLSAGSALAGSDLLPRTQSPTPSTVATPQPVPSPSSMPAHAVLPELSPPPQSLTARENGSSPAPTLNVEQLETPAPQPLSDPIPDQRDRFPDSTPEPRVILQVQLNSRNSPATHQQSSSLNPHLLPPASSPNLVLPDPIKQSIEELPSLANLPASPRSAQSIASTYDSDDYFKRESSIQSTSQVSMPPKRAASVAATERPRSVSEVPDTQKDHPASGPPAHPGAQMQQPIQPSLGPHYTGAELSRIEQQKILVQKGVEHAVAEAKKYHHYVEAYALRLAFNHNQNNGRFLLQTEAMQKQLITKEAAGDWARKLQPYMEEGAKEHTALKHFVPEAATDLSVIEAHQPQAAPYAHLVSIDLSEVRSLKRKRAQPGTTEASESPTEVRSTDETTGDHSETLATLQKHVVAGHSLAAQAAEREEPEAERVATPPRKRQKTQRDSSKVHKASTSSTTRNMNGTTPKSAPQPPRRRAGSNVSNASSALSSVPSEISEASGEDLTEAAQPAEADKKEKKKKTNRKTRGSTLEQAKVQEGGHGAQHQQQQDQMQEGGFEGPGDGSRRVNGGTSAKPITEEGPRRLPARRARGSVNPEGYYPRDPFSNPHTNSHSNSHPQSTTSSNQPNHNPNTTNADAMSIDGQPASTNGAAAAHSNQPTKKSKRGMPDFTPKYRLDDEDQGARLRAHSRNITQKLTDDARKASSDGAKDLKDVQDSFIRRSARAPSPPERPSSSASSLTSVPQEEVDDLELELETRPAAQKDRAAPGNARPTRACKRAFDEVEDDATPFSQDFGGEAGPGTGAGSRAETPRPAKRQKGTRRLKQSPMKNKSGPSAGAASAQGGKRATPGENGASNNQEDNDDFCSFCGGNGNLVCCDGCNKAFHWMDHTPIVDPNEDAAWFCWDCMVKRDPSLVSEHKGPFGSLITNLEKKHAKAFILPKKIRDYFEGVKTGVEGEYEEFVPPAKGKKKEKAEDKEFDYFQLVDKNEKPILCHSCYKSSENKRAIVPCSLCGLWWHADCLDPPRTSPPNPRTFVCPAHVDDLLHKVPSQMGPAHKFRKIKGSSDISYAFRRGNINNGWVEVDDDEPNGRLMDPHVAAEDLLKWGRIHRVRSSGIRDDFITKIGGCKRPRKSRPVVEVPRKPKLPNLPPADYTEDAEERYEAALNIMAFSRKVQARSGEHSAKVSAQAPDLTSEDHRMYISQQHIEAASVSELSELEKKLDQMQKMVQEQRAKRHRDDLDRPGPSTRPKISHPDHGPSSFWSTGGSNLGVITGAEHTSPTVISEDSPAVDVDNNHAPIEQEATEPADQLAPAVITDDAAKACINKETTYKCAESSAADKASAAAVEPLSAIPNESAVNDTLVENLFDHVAEAALTPVSDAAKDGDGQSAEAPIIKPMLNGIETPETTVADQDTSPTATEP